jgi:Abortive infection alpha
MATESDENAETAKAVQEIARTTGKTVDAVQQLGEFVGSVTKQPLLNAVGIVADRLAYARWERQQRLINRAQKFMEEQNISYTTAIPLNVAIPLLQAATLEEEDELQDLWVQLLVNAVDSNFDIKIRRLYISILEDFTSVEAKILWVLYEASQTTGDITFRSKALPFKAVRVDDDKDGGLPSLDVQEALWNLQRLGCVSFDTMAGGPEEATNVCITPLGQALVTACTRRS